jgi:hypothetical protein
MSILGGLSERAFIFCSVVGSLISSHPAVARCILNSPLKMRNASCHHACALKFLWSLQQFDASALSLSYLLLLSADLSSAAAGCII